MQAVTMGKKSDELPVFHAIANTLPTATTPRMETTVRNNAFSLAGLALRNSFISLLFSAGVPVDLTTIAIKS
jgi:hypothetical protein